MLRAGILELLSLEIYGDPMHLVHLFEDIHFMLFFVMLLFLFEAVVLVKSAMKVHRMTRQRTFLCPRAATGGRDEGRIWRSPAASTAAASEDTLTLRLPVLHGCAHAPPLTPHGPNYSSTWRRDPSSPPPPSRQPPTANRQPPTASHPTILRTPQLPILTRTPSRPSRAD